MSGYKRNVFVTWGGQPISPPSSERLDGMAARRRLEADLSYRPILALRSDRLLAEDYGVSVLTVNRARRKLESDGSIPVTATRLCRDGRERCFKRIGADGDERVRASQ